MNKVTEQELVDRLDTARAWATKIANLQAAKIRLMKIIASGHAVEITITSHTTQPVELQADGASLTAFEPSELHCILELSLSVVQEKLIELKRKYDEA